LPLLFMLVFAYSPVTAQNYEQVDATIVLYPDRFDSPEQLSRFISRDFTTEEDKVRAIYGWIINNISYDPDEYKKFNFNFKNYRERNAKEEKTRENVIRRTLEKGIAVCEGYAMLFEKLCELQGISNYLVRGDIKTNFDDIGRAFKQTHMWNVAMIDGKPYLFDPTWGAGKYRDKFIKEPSYFFYKTPPDLFFKTHYPSMLEDAFIDKIVSREVFSTMPLIIDEKLRLDDIETPMHGLLRTDEYFDEVFFTLNNCSANEVTFSYGGTKGVAKNVEVVGGRLNFSIPLQLGVKTLLIYFDGRPALGYRIQ
jgi:transglutaminase/protease-like cytokinesis protein 3